MVNCCMVYDCKALESQESSMRKAATPSLEPEIQDFITDLFAAAAAMTSIRRAIARRAGVGSTELAILLAVPRLMSDGPVSVRLVAQHLHLAASNITAEVGNLVEAGLLQKVANPNDSRAVQLTISADGQKFLGSLVPLINEMNAVMFKSLPRSLLAQHGEFYRGIVDRTPPTLAALGAFQLEPSTKPAPRGGGKTPGSRKRG
jgi:DNA-binding MarR family transcriptional regulator